MSSCSLACLPAFLLCCFLAVPSLACPPFEFGLPKKTHTHTQLHFPFWDRCASSQSVLPPIFLRQHKLLSPSLPLASFSNPPSETALGPPLYCFSAFFSAKTDPAFITHSLFALFFLLLCLYCCVFVCLFVCFFLANQGHCGHIARTA